MKQKKLKMFLAILLIYPPALMARGIDNIVESLKSLDNYEATIDYTVLMSLQDDVSYTVNLRQWAAPTDTLSPCDYLIDWTLATPDGEMKGFGAYFNGNAYTFRGDRMLEYHQATDPTQFQSRGTGAAALPGVQRRMQFCEYLPAFIAEQLAQIASSPDYIYTVHPDTVTDGRHCMAIDGKMIIDGNVYKEFTYLFDRDSARPLMVIRENNPGAMAEQTIKASFSYPATTDTGNTIDEPTLRNIYPDIFDTYRESTFTIANLPGLRMPQFTLPTIDGKRINHMRADRFSAPTIVALLDPVGVFTPATIAAVRKAVDTMPFNAQIFWAFTDNRIDDIESLIGPASIGETTLISARPLARDCGVNTYPTLIFVTPDGTVSDVALGFNNNLTSVVIQKAASAAK